jgi:hypothetical protein
MGEVSGEGAGSPPLGTRGFATRRGEEGAMLRVGDCCRLVFARLGSTRLLRLCSRLLVTRLRLNSGAGESVRTGIEANEERTLLSLSAPASLSGANIAALFW